MSNPLRVVVDADAIIAQINSKDKHFQRSNEISRFLTERGAQVIYPSSVIVEAITFIQRVLNNPPGAYEAAVVLMNKNVEVVSVDGVLIRKALGFFGPRSSKKNTLFDCIVAAVAKEYDADAIFSFDHFYKSRGFTLVGDFLAGK